MYGGTCINIGCIPTKTLIHAAETGQDYSTAMAERDSVTSKLRTKNYNMLANADTVDVYTAKASFVSNKVIKLSSETEEKELTSEIIIINTGAISNVLPIPGLKESKHVYDSTEIQTVKEQPKRLGIIGGGNIGLEFGGLYAKLGSQVTVFDTTSRILMREEEDVAELATQYLEEEGISFELESQIANVKNQGEEVVITTQRGDYTFDAVLYATGRKPNTADLGLENTDIKVNDRGAIQVDEFKQTSVKNVFAVGDVNGGLQFTYVSLDDYRIVMSYLVGDKSYSEKVRKNIPNTTFINPPLSRVGIDEATAKEKGLHYKANQLLVANMPRGHVNNDLRGIYKVVVDADTDLILGATLFAAEAQETINIITMAMDNKVPYTYLRDQIFTHPTMAENLNDVFNI
ncbi:hypothetical protein HMPREF9318_00480 [Streptococcus urinalis FB127-CNA-2]|uniref:Pyridine nucleotide-disulfide oxidoreductase, dimerization domain protein n=1 Tax=Streptococcus urinalis 2285-97 TaxID=764291 RepID=G5KG72_9STRE|nr:pyridine nucleotide-disulfide oxidoreductase, dimerization domain protein [Streptococcus urinalis 2285-97]EKS22282.1 hypothetical protein HMPREF9318_00480 [Streptococcus urinalis FB127-CNA-2]VEF32094.1 Putative Dihydrolipoamide dehydrogenase; Mercuric ion reductase; PF00070 family, FAD-dependent NAD(P)-disulphide oxidoreductase [Streptococcus urinalis]